jgi:GMP synthase-like glutamine amidotransferase
MKIAILKTDTVRAEFARDYGQYPDMFVTLLRQVDPQLQFATFDVEHEQYPEDINAFDAFLLTGSKSSVYDDKPWIRTLEAFVRRLHRQQKVIIGICFGHQLVAQALGGKTEKAAAGWGVGVHAARWQHKPDWVDDDREEFKLLVSHQDQVTEPASGSAILAGSDFCPNAVIQIGQHILTFQGHPEFVRDYSRALLDLRHKVLGEAVYQRGMASLAEATDQLDVAGWIIDFIRRNRRLAGQQEQ